jgi:hypothetical protein
MNCELDLIKKYLKTDFPFVLDIESLDEVPSVINFIDNPETVSSISYMLRVKISESFHNQLKNNQQLNKVITSSFIEKSQQTIKSICPNVDLTLGLVISFISDSQ